MPAFPSPPSPRAALLPSSLSSPPTKPSKGKGKAATPAFDKQHFAHTLDLFAKGFPNYSIPTITELALLACQMDNSQPPLTPPKQPSTKKPHYKKNPDLFIDPGFPDHNGRRYSTFADALKADALKQRVAEPIKPLRRVAEPVRPQDWRAAETKKSFVLRPTTKGTRVTELHISLLRTREVSTKLRSVTQYPLHG